MTASSQPAYGMLALAAAGLIVVALLSINVKVRTFTARRLGVRVYDFAADLELPATLRSRSYRFALYLTMKSLPREPG
jgi:hypothetical protein